MKKNGFLSSIGASESDTLLFQYFLIPSIPCSLEPKQVCGFLSKSLDIKSLELVRDYIKFPLQM